MGWGELIGFRLLPWAVCVALGAGLYRRARPWLATPHPLPSALWPRPAGRAGAWLGGAAEGLLFRSLWRENRSLWLLAWPFHLALALLLWRHLTIFLPWFPVPPGWLAPGGAAGLGLALCLLGLTVRRLLVPRLAYLSRPADYLWLFWLLALALSGLHLRLVTRPDPILLRALLAGGPLPGGDFALPAGFYWHYALGLGLLAALPWGKLVHGLAFLLAPARREWGDPRRRWHPNPWDRELAGDDLLVAEADRAGGEEAGR